MRIHATNDVNYQDFDVVLCLVCKSFLISFEACLQGIVFCYVDLCRDTLLTFAFFSKQILLGVDHTSIILCVRNDFAKLARRAKHYYEKESPGLELRTLHVLVRHLRRSSN